MGGFPNISTSFKQTCGSYRYLVCLEWITVSWQRLIEDIEISAYSESKMLPGPNFGLFLRGNGGTFFLLY